MNINFDDWEAEQMLDPEFRALAEELESTYQIARRLLQLQHRQTKENLMVVQKIESTDLGRILEKVKSAKALGLPFILTAEVETKKLGKNQYHSLLYTLCVEAAPRGAVSLTVGGNWRVKE